MSALARIRSAGFSVWLKDNGNIGIRPFNALNLEQLEFLKAHKAEIVEALATAPPAGRISEIEHNAQGRYFKFMATWPDGRQCHLCQMPRMTTAEMLAQFPSITHIEPVTGEEYDDND
jgi:hypothetical protein